jgi:hypothetical protein
MGEREFRAINQHLVDHGVRLPLKDAFAAAPPEPPADWNPDEYMACWEFCDRSHPAARKAYICEIKGQERILVSESS